MSGEESLEEGRTAQFVRYWLGQRPDLDPEALALQLTIARLTIMSRRTLGRMAEAEGITATDFQIMGVIKRGNKDGPIRPSDLWKLFALTPGAITYRINRLFDMGLVKRRAQAGDRRVILLRLTPAGEAKVDKMMTGYTAILNQKLEAMDQLHGGRTELTRLLGALASVWEDDPDEAERD